jgi:hypothetical protein
MKKILLSFVFVLGFLGLYNLSYASITFDPASPFDVANAGHTASKVMMACGTGNQLFQFKGDNMYFAGTCDSSPELIYSMADNGNGTYNFIECQGDENGNCINYPHYSDYLTSSDFVSSASYTWLNTGMSLSCNDPIASNYNANFDEELNYDTLPTSCIYHIGAGGAGIFFGRNEVNKSTANDLMASVGDSTGLTMETLGGILGVIGGILFAFGIIGFIINLINETKEKKRGL